MHLPKSRWTAFSVHIGISLAIFVVLLAAILLRWFPGALFSAAGGWEGVKIVAAVDLVLGPTLTLIVYNIAKPSRELARDLSIIATVQCAALVAGVYIVFNARPVAAVHVFDTFYTFSREDYLVAGSDPSELDRFSGPYPKLVYVEVPQDGSKFISQHVMGLLNGEKPLQERIDLYRGLPRDPDKTTAVLNGTFNNEKGCVELDLETFYAKGRVCFDPKSSHFVAFKEAATP